MPRVRLELTPIFDFSTLATYFAAALLLAIAPGPGQMLVLARSIGGGRRVGVATALGLCLGSLVHTCAAALGLSALLTRSAGLYALVQYLGAANLIFLGLRALRSKSKALGSPANGRRTDFSRVVARGAVTGILNPKLALFFLAFLPQFVRPARGHVLLQFAVLGLLFCVLALLADTAVALAAGRFSGTLRRNPWWAVWRERAVGAVLVTLGLRLALQRRA